MKDIVIYILLIFMAGCSSDEGPQCNGYSVEPSVDFNCNQDTFQVRHSNDAGISGSVRNGRNAPLDMNDSVMTYEVFVGDSSFGVLTFKYNLKQFYCRSGRSIRLEFSKLNIKRSTTAELRNISINGTSYIDSTQDFSEVANGSFIFVSFDI